MKNRLRQINRTTVKTKNSQVRYIAGGLALALLGGIITFVYLNFNQSQTALASDTDNVWYMDFGSQIGIHSEDVSNSFISGIPSGTGRVSIVDGKKDLGSFTLQNPGLTSFGYDSELKGSASSNDSPAKFSVNNYTPGKTFYMKYSVQWDEAKDGEWYFFVGNGASFQNDNLFTQSEVFTGFQIVYNKKDKININYRNGNSWTIFPGKDYPISPNTTYTIELYGNNSKNPVNYSYGAISGCTAKTVNSKSFDLYINGVLVAGNVAKAGLGNDINIDDWMFYGVNSKKNDASIYLDDIYYSNAIPTSTLSPIHQPTNLSFLDTTTNSLKLRFSPAKENVDGYLVLRKAGGDFTSTPKDMTDYTVGTLINGATVAYIGSNTSFTESNLTAGTEYFYKVFSYKGAATCRNYLNTLPLSGSQMTFYTEDIAPFSSLSDGTWLLPTIWQYEYLPGKFKKASKAPTIKNKSITVRKNHKVMSATLVTDNVTIEPNGLLSVSGDLTINDANPIADLVNQGTLVVSGKLNIIGKMENKKGSIMELNNSLEQVIPAGAYANLKLNNKGLKKLTGDITINESLFLNSTTVNTGNHTISLSATASIIGESKTSFIKGKIKTIRPINGNVEKFGGIGVEIDAIDNKENLGNVTVIRTTGASVIVGSSSSLSKTWSIEPMSQPKKDVLLTINWTENDEDIPFDLTKMQVWKSIDKGKNWMAVGTSQLAKDRKISVTTPSFSDWTVSDNMNTLPVTFRSFSGIENTDNTLTLEWATSKELNNQGFEVEKSLDGKAFNKIGFVEGTGTSDNINNYEFVDPSFTSRSYYRLKQLDFNGESDYSTIIFIEKKITNASLSKSFSLYPNPVIDHVTIRSSIPDISEMEIVIHSSKGKQVLKAEGTLEDINEIISSNLLSWPEDIYILDIRSGDKQERIKMIKKG